MAGINGSSLAIIREVLVRPAAGELELALSQDVTVFLNFELNFKLNVNFKFEHQVATQLSLARRMALAVLAPRSH